MIARPSIGKQIAVGGVKKPKMPKPDLDMAEMDTSTPNFRSRALRPGGMKKGGGVKVSKGKGRR